MKMKTTTFASTLLVMILMSCNGQHRLEHWKTNKISSIQMDIKQSDGNTDIILILDQSEIKKVMDFLLRTTFEPYAEEPLKELPSKDQWAIRLIFEDQRDQIFLFEEHAFIGKSTYLINKSVVKDFKKLIL